MTKKNNLTSRRKFISKTGVAMAGVTLGATGFGSFSCNNNSAGDKANDPGLINYTRNLSLTDSYDVVVCGGVPPRSTLV